MTLDSGAAVTALPRRIGKDYHVEKDRITGTMYKSAGGQRVADEGKKCLHVVNDQGNVRRMRGRVTGVHKPLVAAPSPLQDRHAHHPGKNPVGTISRILSRADFACPRRLSRKLAIRSSTGLTLTCIRLAVEVRAVEAQGIPT